MPLCAFDETYLMMGVTPVENIFIMNYLPKAPGDFVRVYLFGLFQCYHPDSDMTPARMGRLLDLTEEEVTGAFQYWERMGIVKRVSDNPPAYHYLNIAMTWGDESPMEKAIYRHQDFNNRLQQLYGTRILHPAEYDLAAQWVEELGLPEEVVLILVENEIEKKAKKGQLPSFKYMDKIALQWAKKSINTAALALSQVTREGSAGQLAARILRRFSLRREPTQDEVELCRKWMDDWRLSEEDVVAACEDTTAAKQPSLKYLDRILEKRVSLIKSAPTPEKQARVVQDDQAAWDAVKRIHEALGIAQAAPTPEEKSAYFGFLSAGFEPEAVFTMADAMGKKHPGRYSMDRLEAQMNAMSEKGCLTEAQIRAYIDRQTELERQAERIFSLCDYKNNVNTAATAQMEDWLKLGDLSLIECAAERARGTKLPLQYITKLLHEWKKENITTAEQARAAQPKAAAASKKLNAQQYAQRAYTDAEIDAMLPDLSRYEEVNKP